MLRDLGAMRLRVESRVSLRAEDTAREFGALLTEWDGNGAPSSAVLAARWCRLRCRRRVGAHALEE
jgi:hypothetical protein